MLDKPVFCDACGNRMHIETVGDTVMYQCKCGNTKSLPDEILSKYRVKTKQKKLKEKRGKSRKSLFDSYPGEISPSYPKDLHTNIKNFESDKKLKHKITKGETAEINFRSIYPFRKNLSLIEDLTEADLYNIPANEYGSFFKQIDFKLEGGLGLNPKQFMMITEHLDNFKEWLYLAVDDSLSLAEKLDFNWDMIPSMGGDHLLAKKIIYGFYEEMLPIFNTQHLKTMYETFFGTIPSLYGKSESEEYEFLMSQMIKAKNEDSIMKDWPNIKFMYFLYNYYDPR